MALTTGPNIQSLLAEIPSSGQTSSCTSVTLTLRQLRRPWLREPSLRTSGAGSLTWTPGGGWRAQAVTGLSGTDFQVKAILEEILERVPEMFNMAEIMAKATERTPYVVVAFQECERMNILTNEMRRSLKELSLGLKVTQDSQDSGTGRRRRAGHRQALRDTGSRALGVGTALLPLGSLVRSCGPARLGGRTSSRDLWHGQGGRNQTWDLPGPHAPSAPPMCVSGGTDHHDRHGRPVHSAVL